MTTVLAVVAVLVVLATFVGIWAYINQPATTPAPCLRGERRRQRGRVNEGDASA